MRTQTMGSQGGAVQDPKLQSLTRQGSLYNLTLDEVQNQLGDLGKPLGSMNLDELLKSVWSAEANQATGMGVDNSSAQASQGASASSLPRQGSLTLFTDLSKKTVDEVWKDIQQKKSVDNERKAQDRHPTLGEMTLEDFLVKAGVVAKTPSSQKGVGPVLGVDPIAPAQHDISQHIQWMQYQLPPVQQSQRQHQLNSMAVFMQGHSVQQPLPDSGNPMLEAAYSENQMIMSPSSLMGALSDTQTPGRKRVAPEDVVEKTVERRQKRMIKNRESAARSRARRQAYTHELENKVSRLEEENEKLRRQKVCAASHLNLLCFRVLFFGLHHCHLFMLCWY
ncbi:ABSCISIC ACID-INSENSITIVE 5-like protein 2 isoform X1 [Cannabis sativa]|uniref:ABSCISIC ACID-INSENSITIVE 5-like protein 2 isoform X1 n=1 Tax=Cannabis sativa TaxID=3483 RepID=UPI0029CA0233|nr:ABSCISIC ACID-INSENSITIVE 5-like protein 2 isoform X1 [Cannabis sativa]